MGISNTVLRNIIEDMTLRHNFNAHWHFEFSKSTNVLCLNCTLSITENIFEIENCQFFTEWISQSENIKMNPNDSKIIMTLSVRLIYHKLVQRLIHHYPVRISPFLLEHSFLIRLLDNRKRTLKRDESPCTLL